MTQEKSEGKVIDTQPASRVRVDCQRNSSQSSSQSGYINIPCSQTTGARTRTRGNAIRCREAYFRAWRIAMFGDDIDPIRRAVDEAVVAFSFYKDDAGRKSDHSLWLKIANRAGLEAFLDAFQQKASEIEDLEFRHRRLRFPAASFQTLLNKRFPKEGGVA